MGSVRRGSGCTYSGGLAAPGRLTDCPSASARSRVYRLPKSSRRIRHHIPGNPRIKKPDSLGEHNPQAKVPVLVDHASGMTIPESDTILRFIVDKYAECVPLLSLCVCGVKPVMLAPCFF